MNVREREIYRDRQRQRQRQRDRQRETAKDKDIDNDIHRQWKTLKKALTHYKRSLSTFLSNEELVWFSS